MKNLTLILKCVFLSGACCCFMQTSFEQPSVFSAEKYTNGEGDTLNYRQLYPDSDPMRKYPLVIFLHGSGNEDAIMMPN